MLDTASAGRKDAAVATTVAALKIPTVLNFDCLVNERSIKDLKEEPLFALLLIFVKGNVSDYLAFSNSNSSILEMHGRFDVMHYATFL